MSDLFPETQISPRLRLESIATQALTVRRLQREYWRTRDREILDRSKKAERGLDLMLKAALAEGLISIEPLTSSRSSPGGSS